MTDTKAHYDVVIIGGAVIGSAVAYFLTANPDFSGSVLIIERDPTFEWASTALSAAGIRHQFSNAINVKISQFGTDFIRRAPKTLGVDLGLHEQGYLFLAKTPGQVKILQTNHAVQRGEGADVVLLDRTQLAQQFPHLNVADIEMASWGQSGEGWFDNTGLMNAFRGTARAAGAAFTVGEVVAITRKADRIEAVTFADDRVITCGSLVNASGPRASQTAQMADLALPVEPRKRTVFAFDCQNNPAGALPLMIDPTGVWSRPEGHQFITGCTPLNDNAVDFDDFEPDYDQFEHIIWPTLAERSPAFEAIKMTRAWAGHYAYNTLDHNVVVGPHNDVSNFIFANGFSGHGLQQSPAIGRGVAEWLTYGAYRTLDLTPLGYERVIRNEPFLERAII